MKKKIKELFFILLGTFILSFSVEEFILPGNILSGGIAGIVVLLKPFIPNLSEGVMVSVLSVLLFVIGFIFLGKQFAASTALSALTYPVFVLLLEKFFPHFSVEPILCAIYGGVLGGVGIGMVIRQGGSTGGMDIPPLIINKYFGFSVSKCIMVVDAITVILGLWIYGIEAVLFGLINVYVSGVAIEKVVSSYNGSDSKEIKIISNEYEKIAEAIHNDMDRGTTIINAKGGYTGIDRPMLLVIVPENQYQSVIEIVNKFDEKAFVVISETRDVHGEGFTFEPRM